MNLFDIKRKLVVISGGEGFLGQSYMEYFNRNSVLPIIWDLPEVDITKKENIIKALKDIEPFRTHYRKVVPDVLINNAAIDFPPGSSGEEFEKVWKVNVEGAINCIEAVAPLMAEHGGGSIVNIGSIYGMVAPDHRIYDDGFKKPFSYGVTKSALLMVTKYFAGLWADKGIRVNTLTLGGVKKDQSEGFIRRYSDKVPMGRMANPDDYFGVLHFLVSDASKYMTGANLVVDGGYLIQ